jgi:hypothetical protein
MERSPYQNPQGEDAASTARRAAGQARDKAQELGHRAVEQAKSTAESAKQRAQSMADEGRNKIAGRMEGVARALKRTASAMQQDENERDLSNVTDQLGTQVEKVSDWLKEHDTRDMIWRVENFARRQPAVFLGGAFVIGLAAARFLKSSGSRLEDEYDYELDIEPIEGRAGQAGHYAEYERVEPQPTIPVTAQPSAQPPRPQPSQEPQTPGAFSGMPGSSSSVRRP